MKPLSRLTVYLTLFLVPYITIMYDKWTGFYWAIDINGCPLGRVYQTSICLVGILMEVILRLIKQEAQP